MTLVGCAGGGSEAGSAPADSLHVSCLREPPVTGRCAQPRPAFYYDYKSDSCRPLRSAVCDPNWPFKTLKDCVKACGGRPLR
jgi:hypothetical protein